MASETAISEKQTILKNMEGILDEGIAEVHLRVMSEILGFESASDFMAL